MGSNQSADEKTKDSIPETLIKYGSKRYQIGLLKHATKTCRNVSNGQRRQSYQKVVLFDGSKDKPNFSEEEKNCTHDQIKSMAEILDDFSEQEFSYNVITLQMGKIRPHIYDISIAPSLSCSFTKKLNSVLVDPSLHLTRIVYLVSGRFTAYYDDKQEPGELVWHAFSVEQLITNNCEQPWFQGHAEMKALFYQTENPKQDQEFKFEYSVTLSWERFGNYRKPSINVLDKLFEERLLADCVLVASNRKEISCHRNIVAAHSDVLYAMLNSGLRESESNRIQMDDLSEDGLEFLVAFFYKNEKLDVYQFDMIEEEVALQLLQTAHKYDIVNLENLMVDYICRKPGPWFSLPFVFRYYMFTKNVRNFKLLADKMVRILKSNAKLLRSTEAYQDFLETCPKEAAELTGLLVEKMATK